MLQAFGSVLLTLFLLIISTSCFGQDNENLTTIYQTQTVTQRDRHWQMGAYIGSEIGNSYYDSEQQSVELDYQLTDYLGIGLLHSLNTTRKNSISQAIDADPSIYGYRLREANSISTTHFILNWMPLIGIFNFLGQDTLEAELQFQIGLGRPTAGYFGQAAFLSFGSKIWMSKSWGLVIRQNFEHFVKTYQDQANTHSFFVLGTTFMF